MASISRFSKNKTFFQIVIMFILLSCGTRSLDKHWSYHENEGPDKWAALSPEYALCDSGQMQSPINIVPFHSSLFEKWELHYRTTSLNIAHNSHVEELIDNGHTIQVTLDKGSFVSLNGKKFELKQFHFHTPSEHTLNGVYAPMEVHFVHQSDDKKFVVIAAMVKEGRVNNNMSSLIQQLPNAVGDKKRDVNIRFNPQTFLSNDLSAYHYSGSLTTPPCIEEVQWLILDKPIRMSRSQIGEFEKRLHHNNRPLRPLNGRQITRDEIIIRR